MEGRRPLVAVSIGFTDYGDYIGFGYGRPLLAAGALPMFLPFYEDAADRDAMLDRVDGFVLAGGRDIDPWRYGRAERHPLQGAPDPLLDELELWYARGAVTRGIPLLAVCRGCQIVNVAFGGTLFGDASEFPGGGVEHPHAKWDEWRALVEATLAGERRPPHPTHPVNVKPGSVLAARLGERAVVDSYHHQAIDRLGDGVDAVAWSPDGVVEAIEMPGAEAFVLGVQWELHEEWQDDPSSFALWQTFVAAASERASRREDQPEPAVAP